MRHRPGLPPYLRVVVAAVVVGATMAVSVVVGTTASGSVNVGSAMREPAGEVGGRFVVNGFPVGSACVVSPAVLVVEGLVWVSVGLVVVPCVSALSTVEVPSPVEPPPEQLLAFASSGKTRPLEGRL